MTTTQPTFTRSTENPSERQDGMQDAELYSKAENRRKVTTHALENDRFLGDAGRQYQPTRRRGRSSYEIQSFGFHRGREGVRNNNKIIYRRNGCSGVRYEGGEHKTRGEGGEGNCGDGVSPSDYENFRSQSSSTISPSPLQDSHDTFSSQVESYSTNDKWEVTAPPETQFGAGSAGTRPNSGSQRTGRNENYRTDLIRYGDTSSSQPVETRDGFESLGHRGASLGAGETSRNGRQTMTGSDETREGEVSQPVEPYAAAEPRQRDSVTSYYDFLINEGSYKFWAVFQVVTACLLIYSAFAAIYYAKYTFSMMDYPDYLDEGFFFKRSGEFYVTTTTTTTTTAKPSSYSFLGLSPQTFQRIMNALSSKKYS